MTEQAEAWRTRGSYLALAGHAIFTVDVPAVTERRPPLLVLHGFPTSSFDFHPVVDALRRERRVVLFDMLGYGLSDKPDQAYSLGQQADIAEGVADALGLDAFGLLTHDVGDSVGGELLARNLSGDWDVEVTDRVLLNGSIYLELAQLSAGQLLLLDLPDAKLDTDSPISEETVMAGVAATFSPVSSVDAGDLSAAGEMLAHQDGHLLLPRVIRYIEDRRRHEDRYTGAIEGHPSPLALVWGRDDPIAVPAMVDRLRQARGDTPAIILDGVGHYPMVEAPDRFLDAMASLSG